MDIEALGDWTKAEDTHAVATSEQVVEMMNTVSRINPNPNLYKFRVDQLIIVYNRSSMTYDCRDFPRCAGEPD